MIKHEVQKSESLVRNTDTFSGNFYNNNVILKQSRTTIAILSLDNISIEFNSRKFHYKQDRLCIHAW